MIFLLISFIKMEDINNLNEESVPYTGNEIENKSDATFSSETTELADELKEALVIYESLNWENIPDWESFLKAWKVHKIAESEWRIKNPKYLTVVDFTKNQIKDNRLFVINMDTNTVEYAEKCGHGQGSGWKEWATSFWNTSWSSLWDIKWSNSWRHTREGTYPEPAMYWESRRENAARTTKRNKRREEEKRKEEEKRTRFSKEDREEIFSRIDSLK